MEQLDTVWRRIRQKPASVDAIATVTPAADRLVYFTGATTASLAVYTAFARTLDAAINAAAARTILEVPSSAEVIDALAGKADLVDGKIPANQIPSIAITEYLGDVANEAAMLALTGEKGDWCNRTDTQSMWILTGDDPSQLSDWTEILYQPVPVTSVNGEIGDVIFVTANAGSDAAFSGTTLNLPSMAVSGVDRGLIISSAQVLPGTKQFSGGVFIGDPGYVKGAWFPLSGTISRLIVGSDGVTGGIELSAGGGNVSDYTSATRGDVRYYRNATGPKASIRAAGGLEVKTLDGSADAPITAGAGTFSAGIASTLGSGYIYQANWSGASFICQWNGNIIVGLGGLSGIRLANGMGVAFCSDNNTINNPAIFQVRNSTGELDIRGDNGIRIRNLANSADAPITCAALTASGNLKVGSTTTYLTNNGAAAWRVLYNGDPSVYYEFGNGVFRVSAFGNGTLRLADVYLYAASGGSAFEINNGTPGTYRDLIARAATFTVAASKSYSIDAHNIDGVAFYSSAASGGYLFASTSSAGSRGFGWFGTTSIEFGNRLTSSTFGTSIWRGDVQQILSSAGQYLSIQGAYMGLGSGQYFCWTSGDGRNGLGNGQAESRLGRIAANAIGIHGATTAQKLQVFNTYTDASNGEWAELDWQTTANTLRIGTNKNGTGSTRNVHIIEGGLVRATFSGEYSTFRGDNPGDDSRAVRLRSSGVTNYIYFGSNLFAAGGISSGNTISLAAPLNMQAAGAASTSGVKLTGTWYTGGTSTTTTPQLLVEPTGTTSTGWSTSGTGIGVNAASGFAGNLLDLQVAGGSLASVSVVSGTGHVTARRFVFSDNPSVRFLTSSLWSGDNGIAIQTTAGDITLRGRTSTYGWNFSLDVCSGGVWGTGSKTYTVRGFDQDAVANRGKCDLLVRGGNANPTAESVSGQTIIGGVITIAGGDGASGAVGDAHGGSAYQYGGLGYGTGLSGNVILAHTGSAVRGKVLVGTATADGTAAVLQVAGAAKFTGAVRGTAGFFTDASAVTGMYPNANTRFEIRCNNTIAAYFDASLGIFSGNGGEGWCGNLAACSRTVPTLIPRANSTTTGIGGDPANGILSLIVGGTEVQYVSTTAATFPVAVVASKSIRQSSELMATPSGTTQTLVLNDGNLQTINLGSTTGDTTVTLTVPSSSAVGSILITQHGSTARDITWAASAGSIIWLGTEPTWNADGVGTTREVRWRFNGTNLYLEASGPTA